MNYHILFEDKKEIEPNIIVSDELFNIVKFDNDKQYVLLLEIDPYDNMKDISNITKLFNYIDALKALNQKSGFLWNNFCVLVQIYKESDFWRMESMLSAQAIINKGIFSIFLHKCYVSDELSEDSLFLLSNYFRYSFRKILPIFSFCGDDRKNFYTEHIYFKNVVDPNMALNKNDFQKIINDAITKIHINSNTTEIKNQYKVYNTQIDLFKKIIADNLTNTLTKIKGAQEQKNRFNREEKDIFIQDFSNCVCEKFIGLNLLSQYIWTNMLCFLIENKEIITVKEGIHTLELNLSVIEKSFCDAIAYSEGIYQLMENSVLHTRFQISNLAIRNYEIRKDNIIKDTTLIKNLNTRVQLLNKFGERAFKIKDDVRYCMEILYCDCALSQSNGICSGITDTYNKSHTDKDDKIESVKNLFEKTLAGEDIAKHYGLQLFEKNTILNNGIFKLTTPISINSESSVEEYVSHYIESNSQCKRKYRIVEKKSVSTCYNILLPITYKWSELKSKSGFIRNNGWLYENKLFNDSYDITIINHEISSDSEFDNVNKKTEEIEYEYQRLNSSSKNYANKNNKTIIKIQADNLGFRKIEILAKAIFMYIYDCKSYKDANDKDILFALFFDKDYQINEFIRIFSVFYDKKGYNDYFKNLQIGLFLNPERSNNNHSPDLGVIIAGGNINEIYQSAITYAYSNSSVSVRFVNQCRYFVRTIGKQENMLEEAVIPLFPFDLFLKNDKGIPYFLNNLENEIKSHDIREHDYGCIIEDIHIRLGSKIHLKDFYEAELVFHNGNNINKLAYLIAMDIAKKNKKEITTHAYPIMIVGYEAYSSLLIQEVVRLLKTSIYDYTKENAFLNQVNYCIFSTNENGEDMINYSPDVLNNTNSKRLITDSVYFPILPIGTTLTTIYKIQNTIRRYSAINYKNSNLTFNMNYVLIVISQSEDKSINNMYWKLNNNSNLIVLEKETNDSNCEIYVKPFIIIETEWLYPPKTVDEIEKYKWKDNALIYVDKTSTIPNAIFKLNKTKRKTIKSNEYINNGYTGFEVLKRASFLELNEKNIEKMQGCITYGHIKKRDNHYLYYIDAEKYFFKVKKNVVMWLKHNAVKDDGYNIIISPLHNPDSSFLKAVIDNGFLHNFRLIHVPIYDSKRDEILTKFSYIMKQYEEIRINYANQKINFYFVDHSIVTGKTVARSLSLIRSLMRQSGFESDIPMYFKGIFTLFNRSTADTISTYVKNVNSDYKSFAYLFVPNFNTHNNECPACDLVSKYKYLEKNSSTNLLSNEYSRLSAKHSLKDLDEYNQWLENNIIYHKGYYNKLKQWLYRIVYFFDCETNKKSSAIDIEPDDERIISMLYNSIIKKEKEIILNSIKYNSNSTKELKHILASEFEKKSMSVCHINSAANLTVSDYGDDFQKNAVYIFVKYIQAEKSFIRLQCTHRVFKIFESNLAPEETKDSVNYFEDQFLNLIYAEINNENVWDLGMEYFISYIKIISRPFIAEYYNIRNSILHIIYNFLELFLHNKSVPDKPIYKSINSKVFNKKTSKGESYKYVLEYQLLLCLSRRITDLHSQYFLSYKNIEQLLNSWNDIKDGFFKKYAESFNNNMDYFIMNTPVSDLRMQFDIVKLAKWSSMSTEEDAGSFVINDLIERGDERE